MEHQITIYYHRLDDSYDGWNGWIWVSEQKGQTVHFTQPCDYGRVGTAVVQNPNNEPYLGLLLRKGEWSDRDIQVDRFVSLKNTDVSIWLLQDEIEIFDSEQDALRAREPRITGAVLKKLNQILVQSNVPMNKVEIGSIEIREKQQHQKIDVTKILDVLKTRILLETKEPLSLEQNYSVSIEGFHGIKNVIIGGDVFNSKGFDSLYYYEGEDLGYCYTKEKTTFKVWSPTADQIELIIYTEGDSAVRDGGTPFEMSMAEKGVWQHTLDGDQNGIFYTYRINHNGIWKEAGDPYAKAVGVNGDRSAVVDLDETDPEGWEKDIPPFTGQSVDAVVYELHVRDFSIDELSGIQYKGKYLAFTEEGTEGPNGVKTGLAHLKEMGITHVHLLPVFDYASVNEKTLDIPQYNWGYDPKNYNVPEGSYATNPYNPVVRIVEFKKMVQALHKKGIAVIMDVVYNHTRDNINSKFHKIVPGYYYRMKEDGTFHDGTFCGNETASEHSMMRKYIIDSVLYWTKEYHIDGFRFDLMGIHDIDTMNAVRKALDEVNPNILIYGEGWDMGNLPKEKKAIQIHANQMLRIGYFNDHVRDVLKGPVANPKEHGFVDGKKNVEIQVKSVVCGSIEYNDTVKDYNAEICQSINYSEVHDNHTLWDKLREANPNVSDEDRIKMHLLANTIIFTSQGMPYLHAGAEFLRTKNGVENSYCSADEVNRLDWTRKANFIDIVEYYKKLIALRKQHAAFRMKSVEEIRKHLHFIDSPKQTVAYTLSDPAGLDPWKCILVVHNASTQQQKISIPKTKWIVVLKDQKIDLDGLEIFEEAEISISPISSIVLYTQNDIKE